MTNAQTIVPHKFSDTHANHLQQSDTYRWQNRYAFARWCLGATHWVSYRDFASTLVIQQDGHTTIYKGMTDNLTGEAIAYGAPYFSIGLLGGVSQQLLDSSIRGLVRRFEPTSVCCWGGVTRFIVGNTSFGLCIGTLMSLIEVTAYSIRTAQLILY